MTQIDVASLDGADAYRLMTDVVVPRPIAWVTTVDEAGTVNLAPFSFFQGVCGSPPTIIVSVGRHKDRLYKDTGVNAVATGELVVNIVSDDLAEAMNVTCGEHPAGVDEMAIAGLTPVSSAHVRPPRVAEARVALECKLVQTVPVGRPPRDYLILIAEIVAFQIHDDLYRDGRVDPVALAPLGRLGGNRYRRGGEVFEMERPVISRTGETP
jgi:flavin reductase (DIM6/NTAB) family NADH-FMN oxidoreductase RutF